MSGSWLAVAIGAVDHPKLLALGSDGARWAWLVVLSAAKRQSPEGRFASVEHLRHCLGAYAGHAEELVDAALLDRLPSGSLEVHDWTDWQIAGPTRIGPDRRARYRARHRDELAEKARARRRGDDRSDARSDTRGDAVATRGDADETGAVVTRGDADHARVATRGDTRDELGVATRGDRTGQDRDTTDGESSPISPPADDDWLDLLVDIAVGIDSGRMPSPNFVRQIVRWEKRFGGKRLLDEVVAAWKRDERDPWDAAVGRLTPTPSSPPSRSSTRSTKYAAAVVHDGEAP